MPVDAEGLDVEHLSLALKRTSVRALYVTPHCHDPTTVTLTARRRLALLELARKHRFAIIEADYDHEFQFEGAPVLPMAATDPYGVVISVGTLSKAIAPGLRMGFVAAPRPLLSTLLAIRGQVDRRKRRCSGGRGSSPGGSTCPQARRFRSYVWASVTSMRESWAKR